jgi:hypothetical protein
MVMDVYEAAEILLSLSEMILRREALRNKGGDGMMMILCIGYNIKNCVNGFVFVLDNWQRFGFTREQEDEMRDMFVRSGGYPARWERQELAARFGYTEKKIYNWFHTLRKD